jgi:hypothetical protein
MHKAAIALAAGADFSLLGPRPSSARPGEATFTVTTRPNAKQQQALDLIAAITV